MKCYKMVLMSALIAGALFASAVATAQEARSYPLIFKSLTDLKKMGIAVRVDNDRGKPLPVRCYYYGDGGVDLSISNELLQHYQSQGFSRRSACLALSSRLRFHPETGARLATFTLLDGDSATEEMPISLPSCFKRAVPLKDCTWNYDYNTGKKLSSAQTQQYRLLGSLVEAEITDKNLRRELSCESAEHPASEPYTSGMLCITGRSWFANWETWPEKGVTIEFGHGYPTLQDWSPDFPLGYGYGLDMDGAAGGSYTAPEMLAALQKKKPAPQIDPKQIKSIWTAGTK